MTLNSHLLNEHGYLLNGMPVSGETIQIAGSTSISSHAVLGEPEQILRRRKSLLIAQQFPAHIREEYGEFVDFLTAYYVFVENELYGSTGPINYLDNFRDSLDIDSATDIFLEKLQEEVAFDFPKTFAADRNIVLKHLREFYTSKGSEESIQILFQMLYKSAASVSYPYEQLLIPSDGIFVINRRFEVYPILGNPFNLEGKLLVGDTTGDSVFIETVMKFYIEGREVYHLYMNFRSLKGTFQQDETMSSEDGTIIVQTIELI